MDQVDEEQNGGPIVLKSSVSTFDLLTPDEKKQLMETSPAVRSEVKAREAQEAYAAKMKQQGPIAPPVLPKVVLAPQPQPQTPAVKATTKKQKTQPNTLTAPAAPAK